MNHNNSDLNNVADLFSLAADGEINDEQFETLKTLLKNNKTARRHYYRLVNIEVLLRDLKGAYDENQESPPEMGFWHEMAEYEKTAPEVEIEKLKTEEVPAESLQIKKMSRKINKFSLYTAIVSTAALIFFILFVKFAPRPLGFEVATLTDSINAKWTDNETPLKNGSRIVTSYEPLLLEKGLAEFLFFNNARIVIEAPAKFQILTSDQIKLFYGRVYATIPQDAIGFTVNTPSAQIIDLGTEFGVEADSNGDTYLHVIRGKTTLIAGTETERISMEIGKGIAKKISAASSVVSDIPCNEKLFVRAFDGDRKLIWRGENLSLTSIVAGRDGFQEVGSLIGLDPVKVEFVTSISAIDEYRRSNEAYNLVPNLQFIDGVFVPDGESGAVQITSLGHTFNCPDTSGKYTHEIAAYKGSIKNLDTTIPPLINNGQEVVNDPILVLHSNTGITFDLRAIRKSLPQLDLKSLKATGVPMIEYKNQDFDFWLLVDGQIKYERKIVTIDSDRSFIPFHVEISPEDRFLTLIITDGLRATDDERKYPYANDFFYLIKPELCLTDSLGR